MLGIGNFAELQSLKFIWKNELKTENKRELYTHTA